MRVEGLLRAGVDGLQHVENDVGDGPGHQGAHLLRRHLSNGAFDQHLDGGFPRAHLDQMLASKPPLSVVSDEDPFASVAR